MTRRMFLCGAIAAALAVPPAAEAQRVTQQPRVAYLGGGVGSRVHVDFEDALRELGYVSGQNITVEYRWYEGRLERAEELASEIIQSKPDVVVTVGPQGAWEAKALIHTLPVVFAAISDPVRDTWSTPISRQER